MWREHDSFLECIVLITINEREMEKNWEKKGWKSIYEKAFVTCCATIFLEKELKYIYNKNENEFFWLLSMFLFLAGRDEY